MATVTNIITSAAQFSLTVTDVNGNIVVSEQPVSINPGQTLSYAYSNTVRSPGATPRKVCIAALAWQPIERAFD